VTVFDAAPIAGGMMRYRIPRTVIPADVLNAEIGNILALGIEFRAGCVVGRDVSLDELRREYGVIFFAIGLQKAGQLELRVGAEGEAAVVGEIPAAPPEIPNAEITETIPRVLNTVSVAIAQGQAVAKAIAAFLQGRAGAEKYSPAVIRTDQLKLDWYKAMPSVEAGAPVTEDEVIAEAARCMSCGMCMDCETCWMYCSKNCFVKLPKGEHYKIMTDLCNGCGKCAESCPCGYIEMN
jgi:Pyruvate/2-oxoacid:ferredoxin oxidoreductase delta subunit